MDQTDDKRFLVLTLFNGHTYDEQKDKKKKNMKYPNLHGSFEKNVLRLDLSSLEFSADNEESMKKPEELMTIRQLDDALDSLVRARDTVSARLRTVIYKPLHLGNTDMSAFAVSESMGLFDQLNKNQQ